MSPGLALSAITAVPEVITRIVARVAGTQLRDGLQDKPALGEPKSAILPKTSPRSWDFIPDGVLYSPARRLIWFSKLSKLLSFILFYDFTQARKPPIYYNS